MKVSFMLPIPFPTTTPPPEGPRELASRQIMYVYKQCSIVDRNDFFIHSCTHQFAGNSEFFNTCIFSGIIMVFFYYCKQKKFKEYFFNAK